MNYNPLEIIEQHWLNHQISINAARNIKTNLNTIPSELLFETEDNFIKWYDVYLDDSKSYIVILLWAEFDKIIIEYLDKEINDLKKNPRVKSIIVNLNDKEIDEWYTKSRLKMLNHLINTMELLQAYDTRNYYAHRNPKKKYVILSPELVYSRIKKAVIALHPNQPIPDNLFE
ncbi:MAG: hypothetical protein HQ591_05700 [candidate division Zixibacteria bacterium]|nr:hypothetical protein [Candidatus Tariuqbacter arcticus]